MERRWKKPQASSALTLALLASSCDAFAQTASQTAPQRRPTAGSVATAAPTAPVGGGDVVARAGDRDMTIAEVRAFLAGLPAEQQAAYRAATNVATSSGEIDLEKVASL